MLPHQVTDPLIQRCETVIREARATVEETGKARQLLRETIQTSIVSPVFNSTLLHSMGEPPSSE